MRGWLGDDLMEERDQFISDHCNLLPSCPKLEGQKCWGSPSNLLVLDLEELYKWISLGATRCEHIIYRVNQFFKLLITD